MKEGEREREGERETLNFICVLIVTIILISNYIATFLIVHTSARDSSFILVSSWSSLRL